LTTDQKVQQLVPLIRQSESKYRDLEIHYKLEYTLLGGKLSVLDSAVTSSAVAVHQITQGDLYWLDYDHHGVTVGKTKTDESFLTGYDGKYTRNWIQHTYGNLHVGQRWESPLLFRPHAFVGLGENIMLSDYLERGDAKRKARVENAGYTVRENVAQIEDGVFLGRKCVVIESVSTYRKEGDGGVTFVSRLWVCPEANYLPVKVEKYKRTEGKDELGETTQVESLKEVEAGVFLPAGATTLGYEDGKAITKRVWAFGETKLRPQYPVVRFAEVGFRKGALVYVIRDGKIERSFKAGEKGELGEGE
jgi:hypothetical protein